MTFNILLLFLPVTPSNPEPAESGVEINNYIVKTTSLGVLEEYAEINGLELGPFFTYTNPSQEALERFSCYHMVIVPEEMADLKQDVVDELSTLLGVEFVEPDLPAVLEVSTRLSRPFPDTVDPHVPDDPWFPQQYWARKTGLDLAWTRTTGQGTMIALIDTGVDTLHEDLVDNLDLELSAEFTPIIQDGFGHGTAVTGIAAAKIDNGTGIAGAAGDCSLLPLPWGDVQDFANATIFAADNGADVISYSSGVFGDTKVFEDATDYAWDKGVFLCDAAGNDNSDDIAAPSTFAHVMSVGGANSLDQRWEDSNYGPIVDIYAPADSIFTTRMESAYGYGSLEGFPSGTSFASPIVAGIAALIKSAYPSYTNQDIWNRLIHTADTITIDKGEVLRVNAARAVGVTSGIGEDPFEDSSDWQVTAIGNRIVLRYEDRPHGFDAVIFDAIGRQIDELHSQGPSGTIHWGHGFNPGVYFVRDMSDNPRTYKLILIN